MRKNQYLVNSKKELAAKLRKTERENERYLKENRSLANISSIIASLPLSENIYDTICDIARTNLNVDLVWLGLTEKGGTKIIPVSSSSNEENESKSAEFTWWDAAAGPSVNTLKTLQIQSAGDTESDTASSPWKNEVCKMGYRSFLSLPVISSNENRLLGLLNMYSRQSHFFEESAATLFRIFSNQASTAIEIRQLIEGLETTVKGKTAELTNEIAEHKIANESIMKLNQRNTAILDSAGEGIIGLDKEMRHIFVNPAAARMLGYSAEELIGKRSHAMWHHTKRDGSPHALQECPILSAINNGLVYHEANDIYWRKDKTSFPVKYTSTPIFEDGKLTGAVIVFDDITEIVRLKEKLENLSLTDELTGFYNRRGFFTLTEQELKLARRNNEKMLLIYADVDNMKVINDRFGHQEGDKALVEIANILRRTFRESDILARLGGDEFAALAVDTGEKSILERLHKNIGYYNEQGNNSYKLSLSVGIACYDPGKPCALDDLLSKADAAMYKNKLSKK